MAADAQTEEEPSIEEILDSIRQIISDEDEVEEGGADAVDDGTAIVEDNTAAEAAEEAAPADDFDAMVADAAEQDDEVAPVEDEPQEQAAEEPQPDTAPAEEDIIELTEQVDAPAEDPAPEESAEETPPEESAEPKQEEQENEIADDPTEDDAMTENSNDDIDALLNENPDDAAMQVDMEESDGASEPAVVPTEAETPTQSVTEEEIAAAASSDDGGIMTDNATDAALGAISALAQQAAVERAGNVTIEDIVREEMRPILRVWLDKNLPAIIERLMTKELERIAKDVQD